MGPAIIVEQLTYDRYVVRPLVRVFHVFFLFIFVIHWDFTNTNKLLLFFIVERRRIQPTTTTNSTNNNKDDDDNNDNNNHNKNHITKLRVEEKIKRFNK